jgi:FkbM family methyltransferase
MALLPRLCMPERISIDVGANYGIYSYYMLKYSAGCVAFEPYPQLAELLRKGLGRRVQVHQVALSDHAGSAQMVASTAQSGQNTIEPSNRIDDKVDDPHSIVTLNVAVRSLDEFRLRPVGFIKIDVQGHEEEVITGGHETIARDLPALLIEAEEQHRAGARQRIAARLRELDYRGFFLRSGRLHPVERFDPSLYQNLARRTDYTRNFVFLPPQRLEAFRSEVQ